MPSINILKTTCIFWLALGTALASPIGPAKCGKNEHGCKNTEDDLTPWFWNFRSWARPHKYKAIIKRFEPDENGQPCGPKTIGKVVRIKKLSCVTFKEKPSPGMAINYILPSSNAANTCDITFFDHKNCHNGNGKVVLQIKGAHSFDEYGAEAFCHSAPMAKSVFFGPCLGQRPDVDFRTGFPDDDLRFANATAPTGGKEEEEEDRDRKTQLLPPLQQTPAPQAAQQPPQQQQ